MAARRSRAPERDGRTPWRSIPGCAGSPCARCSPPSRHRPPPDWALDLLADGLAGHTLFGFNIVDPRPGGRAHRRAARRRAPDALIAIDEEGGDVTRLAHRTGSPYPGNAALGAIDDVELTRAVYRAIGADLAAVGVNRRPGADRRRQHRRRQPDHRHPVVRRRPAAGGRARRRRRRRASRRPASPPAPSTSPGTAPRSPTRTSNCPPWTLPLAVLRERDLPPFAAVVGGRRAGDHDRAHPGARADRRPARPRSAGAALVDLLRGESASPARVITDALEMKGAAVAAGGIAPAAVRGAGGRRRPAVHRRRRGRRAGRGGRGRDRGRGRRRPAGADPGGGGGRPHRGAGRLDLDPPRRRRAATPSLGYAAARRAVRVEGVAGRPGAGRWWSQLESGHSIAEGRVPWGLGRT